MIQRIASRFVLNATCLATLVLAAIVFTPEAHADTIAQNLNTTNLFTLVGFFGQSVTTPLGGPWNNLQFSFVNSSGANTASGNGFILTIPYSGAPQDLQTTTPGFLAKSVSVVSGTWVFSPDTRLNPGTQYFIYGNSLMVIRSNLFDAYPGGNTYTAQTATGLFSATPAPEGNFRLTGTVAVAEPPIFVSLMLGLLGVALRRVQMAS